MIVGTTYLERGRPVTVLVRWARPPQLRGDWPSPPRNVLIRRMDGTSTVRPFRGLRRLPR